MFHWLAHLPQSVLAARRRQRAVADFAHLSNGQLADIGIERGLVPDLVETVDPASAEPATHHARGPSADLSLPGRG